LKNVKGIGEKKYQSFKTIFTIKNWLLLMSRDSSSPGWALVQQINHENTYSIIYIL
jgi:hypothetical protein